MTTPLWLKRGARLPGRALDRDVQADVCVIGAGFAGLTTALRLAQDGRSVVVLEAGEEPGGESCRSTAHVCSALDDGFAELERLHGQAGAALAYESHAAAVDWIERHAFDCGFTRLNGWLHGPADALRRELEAARRAGHAKAEFAAQGPLAGWDGPALKFPRQAQLDPAAYLLGLAEAARGLGAAIHPRTRVTGIEGDVPAFVWTGRGPSVRCQAVVVATNAPINDRLAVSARQSARRTYVVEAALEADLPKGLFWDSEEPYHYVRAAGRRLIAGGEDHVTGRAEDMDARWERLEAWARARFSGIRRFTGRWSGQILEPADKLAFIGRHPTDDENVFIATGDSGNGTTHGTIAGLLLSDLIAGRQSPWEALYSPSRVSLLALPEQLATAALDTAGYAAYAENPPVSRVCPHLGGVVCWNPGELSWDCPVHGSRYGEKGEPLCGPTRRPLPLEESRALRRRPRRSRRGRRGRSVKRVS